MAGDTISVSFARCPRCRRVHTERSNVSVYKCAGCGAILRARHPPEKKKDKEEENIEEQMVSSTSSDTPQSETPNISSLSISASDDGSSEAKSSTPPELSPPATIIQESLSYSGSLSTLENITSKSDKHNRLSRRTFRTYPAMTPESSSGNSAITCSDIGPSSPAQSSDNLYNDLVLTPETKMASPQNSPWTDIGEGSWRGGSHHREDSDITPESINNDGRRDRRSNLWHWSSASEEMAVEQAHEAIWASLEHKRERSWSEGSRQSEEQQAPPMVDGGQRYRRSDPRKQSFSAEEARPKLPRRGSLDDEGGSWRSGGNRSREESEMRKTVAPPMRRICRTVAGAAPLVLCGSCGELLQLPVDIGLVPGRRKLQCGACTNILTFWFSAGGRLRPARSCHD